MSLRKGEKSSGGATKKPRNPCGSEAFLVERVKGIEPSYSAWEADILPMNYTRVTILLL